MNVEGVDVNLMLPSGWFGAWTTIEDLSLETAIYEAYHRWMATYCAAFASRLKGVILISARDIAPHWRSSIVVQRSPGPWRSSFMPLTSFRWTIRIWSRFGKRPPITIYPLRFTLLQ